ncbi:fungal-specific transcription factor domain-containing protein [Aspergillus aurantiobrunneus]
MADRVAKEARARQINASLGIHRRSTNACQRCKRKKIKCFYNSANSHRKCVACSKSRSDCQFDLPPDGVFRGDSYVATLEARIQALESELRAANAQSAFAGNALHLTPPDDGAERRAQMPLSQQAHSRPATSSYPTQETLFKFPREPQAANFDITILDMLHGNKATSEIEEEALPPLPSSNNARALVDTVYFYTQARYCIVDWTRVREWHRNRDAIAYISSQGPVEAQRGAFFIWIIYAIGARLISNPENSSVEYFARARSYLPAVMASQDSATVQALLCIVQYYFRAPTESPIWHLVGFALRLCIRLRYHRAVPNPREAREIDPYSIELRKRFFWCAYCFDRCLAILSKLPFGISDSDIDVDIPVDVDCTCTDQNKIRELQRRQASGQKSPEGITTMTAALHHLQVYRIRSRILANFTGPHAQKPTFDDVMRLLSELDQWRQQAPKKDSRAFPQQNPDRVQATYLQAILLLIRPVLMGNPVDPALIKLCADFSADACESAKSLSLNPQTHADLITVYHFFYCGITLLQCLAIDPTSLTPRRTHQAISACMSALAIYTRELPAAAPHLRLFEEVSNLFIRNDHLGFDPAPREGLSRVLDRIVGCGPEEMEGIWHSLFGKEPETGSVIGTASGTGNGIGMGSQQAQVQVPLIAQQADTQTQTQSGDLGIDTMYDSILGGQSAFPGLGVSPLTIPDISPLFAPDVEMGLWSAPWLDGIEFEG